MTHYDYNPNRLMELSKGIISPNCVLNIVDAWSMQVVVEVWFFVQFETLDRSFIDKIRWYESSFCESIQIDITSIQDCLSMAHLCHNNVWYVPVCLYAKAWFIFSCDFIVTLWLIIARYRFSLIELYFAIQVNVNSCTTKNNLIAKELFPLE